jgi:hypothetical protein
MLQARLTPISTYSDWILSLELTDPDTGDPFDLTGATAAIAVRKIGEETITTVTDTTGGKITFPDTGIIHSELLYGEYEFEIGEYDVRMVLSRDGYTESIIIGTLPVIDGLEP